MSSANSPKWGKDKTPSQGQQFDPNQQYSPQSAQTPGYPGTPSTYFNQYNGMFTRAPFEPFNADAGRRRFLWRPRPAAQLPWPPGAVACWLRRSADGLPAPGPSQRWRIRPRSTGPQLPVEPATPRAELQQRLLGLPGLGVRQPRGRPGSVLASLQFVRRFRCLLLMPGAEQPQGNGTRQSNKKHLRHTALDHFYSNFRCLSFIFGQGLVAVFGLHISSSRGGYSKAVDFFSLLSICW